MPPRHQLRPHALALLLALPASLAAQARSAMPAMPARPDSLPATAPEAPALGAYLDTSAVLRALAARAPFADSRRAARILTLHYDSLGAVASVVAPVPALFSPADRDSLTALIKAHARPIAARRLGWSTHLLLTSGPGARVEETTLAWTPPEIADRRGLTRALERIAHDLVAEDATLLGRTFAVRLRLRLSADGNVASHELLVSSGVARIDEAAVRLVLRTPFRAGIAEGEPVGGMVILPLRFIFPDE